ncbi:MAG: hypothetical protein D6748_02345, partial [Calditrichaeota bacterium]
MLFYKSLIICALLVVTLHGQEGDALSKEAETPLINLSQGVNFEISPHTGAMGGSAIMGLRLSMNYSTLNMEASVEQVFGNTANLYPFFFNLTMNLSTLGRLFPYGTVGIGLLVTVPTDAVGSETVSNMGVNFGGGMRLYFTPTVGIRLEGKQYVTNVTNALDSRDELVIFQEFSL